MNKFTIILAALILAACSQTPSTTNKSKIVVDVQKDSIRNHGDFDFHNGFDTITQIITGKLNLPVFHQGFYTNYSRTMESDFTRIEENRLHPLMNWYNKTKSKIGNHPIEKVLYPFSGGDFLHVHTVYPEATEYTLMAIEPVGKLPNVLEMNLDDKDSVLFQVKYMLRDIFLRSYFITQNMKTDISNKNFIDGVLPMLAWGVGISGYRILSVNSVTIDSTGTLVALPADFRSQSFKHGVQLKIYKEGEKSVKTVNYLSVDLSNNGLSKNKPLRKFLSAYKGVGTFMKAASYLSHYKGFSEIRNYVLSNSVLHLQDDTGIPYENFSAKGFNAMLFGVYTKPIKDFSENLFQPDLAEAYSDSTLYCGALPFSMGYHWSSKAQNQMVFFKSGN